MAEVPMYQVSIESQSVPWEQLPKSQRDSAERAGVEVDITLRQRTQADAAPGIL